MFQWKTEFRSQDGIALLFTLALMALHYAVPRLRRSGWVPEGWVASFGGGFAAAYVFLHLLPGFEQNKQALGELLSEHYRMTPLKDLLVYLTALAGFMIYFGLQRRAEAKRRGEGPSPFDFYLHLAAMGTMNFIITYTMAVRVEVGLDFAILFTLVMGLHFFILDRNLETHFPENFDRQGRLWLMGFLFLGWVLSTVTQPNNVMLVAMLSSFLAGSVLFNVFHSEIPAGGKSSFKGFALGTTVGAALLLLITFLENKA